MGAQLISENIPHQENTAASNIYMRVQRLIHAVLMLHCSNYHLKESEDVYYQLYRMGSMK